MESSTAEKDIGTNLRHFNILCVEGPQPIYTYSELSGQFPNLLRDTDLLVGSSSGTILALGLASESKILEILKICEAFDKDESFVSVLEEEFENILLSDLNKKIIIPYFNVTSSSIQIIHNFYGSPLLKNCVDVILKALHPSMEEFNPSMLALAHILDLRVAATLQNINLLSIGRDTKELDIVDFQCKKFLKDKYHRVNVPFENSLEGQTEKVDLTQTTSWLKDYWK